MKKIGTALLLALLCLALMLPVSLAETRRGVIAREGQEEPIEETLYVSSLGFSFWYAGEYLEVYPVAVGDTEGVFVGTLYSDDAMTLYAVSEDDALEYAEDLDQSLEELSADGRFQVDVYHELEDGRYWFLTLIGEDGQYVSAVGDYAQEAAEGNAKILQLALDSVAFTGEPADGYDPTENQDGDGYEAYERSVLIGDTYYTLGESTVRDLEKHGWAWTQRADGTFAFQVTEEGNEFYVKTDNGQPDGKIVMIDLFYAYDISYEYLGIGFDLAFDAEADTDIYACLEAYYGADFTEEGVLFARTEVSGGTLLMEVGEGALRLTLE